jgi:cytochrome o ubiquinol oxidase subunit II
MRKSKLTKLTKGIALLLFTAMLSSCEDMVVLNSKGPIGRSEAELIYVSFGLMLIVVLPVFVMTFWFAIRYRDSNKKATYKPDWAHSNKIEFVVWTVPIIIIVILSFLTWKSTNELDPYKPIESKVKPLVVDVISLDWNWLFVYPEDSVATLNELVIESGRPVSFRLTSQTVMTSLFIPQLGSQMYAMAGMRTKLNLMADEPGTYVGRNLEYSGNGYHTMNFKVLAKTSEEFKTWLKTAKASSDTLTMAQYEEISKPKEGHPVKVYASIVPDLFDKVMAPFMDWMSCHEMKMDESSQKEECECSDKQMGKCHDKADSESQDMKKDCPEMGKSCHDMDNKKMEGKK